MSNLDKIINNIIEKFNANCVVLREAKYEWTEDKDSSGNQLHREPDISILCGVRHRKKLCYTDCPRFIAEILSDRTESADRNEKMQVYAKVGVEEYWLVDWRKSGIVIERYLLDDDGEQYLLHDTLNSTDDKEQDAYIITLPKIKFKISELMKHIDEEEFM